jgi:hypothetical protein
LFGWNTIGNQPAFSSIDQVGKQGSIQQLPSRQGLDAWIASKRAKVKQDHILFMYHKFYDAACPAMS